MDALHQLTQSTLARLPEPLQEMLRNPLAQKVLAVLAALALLHYISAFLSRSTMNNWQRSAPWRSEKELVLITGGSSGIGKQVAEDMSKTGTRVVILDINEPSEPLPANVTFYRADITKSESIADVAATIRSNHGEPTVLVNNAGVGQDGLIVEKPEAKVRQTFEVNTISHFLMVKEFLPTMVRANHGHVITVASMASFIGLSEITDYCCTKASALAFHEGLRQELRLYYKAPKVRTRHVFPLTFCQSTTLIIAYSIIHPFWVRTPLISVLTENEEHFGQAIMSPKMVSDAICKQILTQNSGQVCVPSSKAVARLVRAMPTWMQENVRAIESEKLFRRRELQIRDQQQQQRK